MNRYHTYNIPAYDLQNHLNGEAQDGYELKHLFYYQSVKNIGCDDLGTYYVHVIFEKSNLGYGEESSAEVIGAAFNKANTIMNQLVALSNKQSPDLSLKAHLGTIMKEVHTLIDILEKQ